MLFLFLILLLFPVVFLGVVKPGFRGSLTLNLNSAGATALGIKTGAVREQVDNIVTNNTGSTLDGSNILPETRVQSVKRCRLNVAAQFSAGAAGDPPNFAAQTIGDIPVVATFGDVITGNFQIEEIGNQIDVNGDINYDFAMISNGAYTRTRGS